VKSSSKKTAELARDHLILVADSGLVTVTGGKWTTYRRMAEDTVNTAIEKAGLPIKECITARLPIHGAPGGSRGSRVYEGNERGSRGIEGNDRGEARDEASTKVSRDDAPTKFEIARLESMPDARFPTLDKIRPVYQHLMNYLQLPAGSGEGNYYDFDLTGFAARFGLEVGAVVNVLKVLDQEGIFSWQQQVYLPARVRFCVGKETLYDFERDHPELEPLIHGLLRGYEGIFDQSVAIRERQVAWQLHISPAQLAAQLEQLNAFRIIDYTPLKESPQLYFFRDRVATEELYIDPVSYREKKEVYATRIRAMIRYLGLGAGECRSRYLAHYFGDKGAGDCGICDNCLAAVRKGALVRPSRR
jgi:hypothetical protein